MAKQAAARKTAKKKPAAAGKKRAPAKVSKLAAKSPARKRPAKKRRAIANPARPSAAALIRLIDCEAAIDEALAALLRLDPETVAHMHELGGRPPLRLQAPGFEGLVWIIVSQQVSVASANAIAARVRAGVVPLEAHRVLELDEDELRACGLSGPKLRTLRALSEAVAHGGLALETLGALPPNEAHARLTAVKGIGPWSADIFLLFCLGHPDAWPVGDIALQEAARLVLKLKKRPDAKQLEKIGERWRPWRGVAARMLWAYYRVAKRLDAMRIAAA